MLSHNTILPEIKDWIFAQVPNYSLVYLITNIINVDITLKTFELSNNILFIITVEILTCKLANFHCQ